MPDGGASIAAIVTIVAGTAQAGAAIAGGISKRKAAKQTAALEQQRLDLTRKSRELNIRRQRAQLRRESRRKRAQLINTAAARGGLFTSSAGQGAQAIQSSTQRELGFIDAGAGLASQADAITSQQINLDAATARSNALTQTLSGIASGGGTAVGAFKDGNPCGGGGTETATSTLGADNLSSIQGSS